MAEEEALQEGQEEQLRIVPGLTPSCKLGLPQWRTEHRRQQPRRRLSPPVRQRRHPRRDQQILAAAPDGKKEFRLIGTTRRHG